MNIRVLYPVVSTSRAASIMDSAASVSSAAVQAQVMFGTDGELPARRPAVRAEDWKTGKG